MCACLQAFGGFNALAFSSLVPTHATFVALARISNSIQQRQHAPPQTKTKKDNEGDKDEHIALLQHRLEQARSRRRSITLEGAPALWLMGWMEATIIAAGLTVVYVIRVEEPDKFTINTPVLGLADVWFIIAACYSALVGVHWALTGLGADG